MKALVIGDMQRWMFRTPDRSAQVTGLLSAINRMTSVFLQDNLPIFSVVTEHKADKSTWSRLMLKHDYACMIEGSEDVQAVDGYREPSEALRIVKRSNSAFLNTNFEQELKDRDVNHLILTGVFIDGCIGLTAADAAQRGFEVTFIEDAIGHTEKKWRGPLFDWLIDDYEISVVKSEDYSSN